MIASQYAPLARRTLKVLPTFRQHMLHMGLGVTGEFGELIDAVKKVFVYGKPYDHTNSIEEVGDNLWYVANLLTELDVDPKHMQQALDRGYVAGVGHQQKMNIWDNFVFAEILLDLNKVVSEQCAVLCRIEETLAGNSGCIAIIETVAGNIGVLCGILGVDPGMAMDKNIEKLAKRYGDKYSDLAALNRDLGGEREVLEGKLINFPTNAVDRGEDPATEKA